MIFWSRMLSDGLWVALLGGALIVGSGWYNPRLFLNPGDLPPDILAAVPPKTQREKAVSLLVGLPLVALLFGLPLWSAVSVENQAGFELPFWALWAHVFGVIMVFNLFDLLVLDLWLFCTVTPQRLVIPGSEGLAGYKDKAFHLRMHARALPALLLHSALIAGAAYLI